MKSKGNTIYPEIITEIENINFLPELKRSQMPIG